jgi:hypothetical protein
MMMQHTILGTYRPIVAPFGVRSVVTGSSDASTRTA